MCWHSPSQSWHVEELKRTGRPRLGYFKSPAAAAAAVRLAESGGAAQAAAAAAAAESPPGGGAYDSEATEDMSEDESADRGAAVKTEDASADAGESADRGTAVKTENASEVSESGDCGATANGCAVARPADAAAAVAPTARDSECIEAALLRVVAEAAEGRRAKSDAAAGGGDGDRGTAANGGGNNNDDNNDNEDNDDNDGNDNDDNDGDGDSGGGVEESWEC